MFAAVEELWGKLGILVHSIAFAPREALQGRVVDCPRDGFLAAMNLSCWSFIDMARRTGRPMTDGGTMLTMSYLGANEVVENCGIMEPVKAALESTVRYVATELGPKGIRAHALSPGPLATRAAPGIRDFDELMARVATRAPARRLVRIEEVGAASVCVGNKLARGEVTSADGSVRDGIVRLVMMLLSDGVIDERGHRAMQAAWAGLPARFRGTQAEMREVVRREALLLRTDRAAALRGLRAIFADPEDRAVAEAAFRQAAAAVGARIDMTPQGPVARLLDRVPRVQPAGA